MLYESKNWLRKGNMPNRKVVDSIFVSIASFRDVELTNTVYSLLSQAKDLSKIHVCILSQDEDDKHPKLESLFDLFNVSDYTYKKINYLESSGVGYARNYIQKQIKPEHDFFFQIDSHTQFIQDWDSILIEDYNKCSEYWGGDIILSSYPLGYLYDSLGNFEYPKSYEPTAVKGIASDNNVLRYACKYSTYFGEDFGFISGYFCAGMVFGKSDLFIDTPYDPNIYFNGEEQTLSIRFYEKGVKLISPPRNYIYHDYDGKKRKRQWDGDQEIHVKNDTSSVNRIKDFYGCKISEPEYSIKDIHSIFNWVYCFVDPDHKEPTV
jgi:hypothetical protein